MNASKPIIIKRSRKKGHAEAHGGSWKVAYADLVTALMAFFLLLWLLAMVSPEKRLALSDYFQNHSVFKDQTAAGGKTMLPGSSGVMDAVQIKTKTSTSLYSPMKGGEIKEGKGENVGSGKSITAEQMAGRLKESIHRKLRDLKEQIVVDIVEGGVRIQIIDIAGSMMFPSGSAVPTPKAVQILDLVAENIHDVDNRIAVEGHTDAAPFIGGRTTNWELSTSRASAARRELEKQGIDSGRIARVVGYADQDLFVKEDPRDPRNRRISIILLQKGGQPEMIPVAPQGVPQPQSVGAAGVTPGQTPTVGRPR